MKRLLVNNQIRTSPVRVIDENGKQLGIFGLEQALQMAKERNLDLIQVTEKVEPPVCKIMDYGKYQYWLQKKRGEAKIKKRDKIKRLRLKMAISLHDMEIKAQKVEKFLKRGDKVKVEMMLRGREKVLQKFAKEKINQFLKMLETKIPIKVERELKKEPRGLTMIISKR